jgi:GNAT superfamily N-acetyltransferase
MFPTVKIEEYTPKSPKIPITDLYKLGHPDGYMLMYLDFCRKAAEFYRKRDFQCGIFTASWENNVVGWAITQDLCYRVENYMELSVYVSPIARGKKVGSSLVQFILNSNPSQKYTAYPRDPEGHAFFKQFPEQIRILT